MNPSTPFKEELELDLLLEQELELVQRSKQFEDNQKRIELERAERECMIPPPDDLEIRRKMKVHYAAVSRGEIKNTRKDQSQSLLLLFMLIAATCALVWWGWNLMQGG